MGGVAYEFGDQVYDQPNRTMVSYAEGMMVKGKHKGLKKEMRSENVPRGVVADAFTSSSSCFNGGVSHFDGQLIVKHQRTLKPPRQPGAAYQPLLFP